MTAQTTAPAAAPKLTKSSLHPCACSLFEVGEFEPNKDGAEFRTDCDRQTKRTFAQGHDARLVGFLAKGELDGYEIRTVQGGVAITFPNAEAAAGSISSALAVKAARMVKLATEKRAARAAKGKPSAADLGIVTEAAASTDRPLTEDEAASVTEQILGGEPQPFEAKIRVGRWTYAATIRPDGSATYTTRLGKEMTAGADTYTLV